MASFTAASMYVYSPGHLQRVAARPEGGCRVCVDGVVCSCFSCLFEVPAVDCVGCFAVVVWLCFDQFPEVGVEVGESVFGVVVCVRLLCVRPCS